MSNKRIRSIAIVSSYARSISNFRGPLVERLNGMGIRVYALAPDFTAQTAQEITELGAIPIDIEMNRTGINPIQEIRTLFSLMRALRKIKPDATYSYFVKPMIYGSIAAWVMRVPFRYSLVAGLGFAFIPAEERLGFRKRVIAVITVALERLSLRRCERVFFQNKDDMQYLIDKRAVSTEQALVIGGSGVDLARFTLAPPVTNPMTYVLIARLLREKGILEFVEAARILRRRDERLSFLLVGGVDQNPGSLTEAQVRSWVSEGAIEWAGEVRDIRPWLNRSSVFVLPSYREGVPRSTQEAMATGRPVVTTDVPGCRETVEDGVNGFLVPPRDAESLAEAMWRFRAEPSLVEVMGQASRRMAEERFDVDLINERIIENLAL